MIIFKPKRLDDARRARCASPILFSLLWAFSAQASAADPSEPGNLRYSVYSDTRAEVFWDRATDDGIVIAYELQINDEVIVVDALSQYWGTLEEGQSYEVQVTSIDNDGDRSAPVSVSFVSGDKSGNGGGTPPSPSEVDAPTDLRGSVYSTKSAEIFWARPDTAGLNYEISRNGAVVSTTNGVSYYDNELEPDTVYNYAVVAIDSEGQRSLASSVALNTGVSGSTESPGSGGGTPPSPSEVDAPTDLRGSVYSTKSAEIFWARPDTAGLNYEISRNGAVVSTTNGVSYYDNELEPDTVYNYAVVAIDSEGQRSLASSVALNTGVSGSTEQPEDDEPPSPLSPLNPSLANDANIIEPADVYVRDGYDPINVLRVDIRTATTPGICTAEDISGCTLADVIADVDKNDDLTVDIAVHFQSDDFPDDGQISNAELRMRGSGSRDGEQKSFRIKLDNKKELWRGERHLQLNKHPFESSRIRSKLAMDLMSQVPNLPSIRTQFVNLWIDDGEGPVDQGLYTHVERGSGYYLDQRGWGEDDNLYKAEDFRFDSEDLEDIRVDDDGEPLSDKRFESVLSIENGDDHRALESMMSALHDPTRSFQSVLDEYFDFDNVMAWVSFNILFQQADITRHNFFLYNPEDSEKFYFIPWDYDAAMGRWTDPPNNLNNDSLRQRIEFGYAVANRNIFLENFYRLPGMHEQILQAAENLRQTVVTDEVMNERVRGYIDLVAPYEQRAPDSLYNPGFTVYLAEELISAPADNLEKLRTGFGVLMAPLLMAPQFEGGQWTFTWTPAYDVTGSSGDISYRLQLATSPMYEDDTIVVDIDGIADAEGTVSQTVSAADLLAGQHYARVIATPENEPEKFWQVSGNKLYQDDSVYYGSLSFSVP